MSTPPSYLAFYAVQPPPPPKWRRTVRPILRFAGVGLAVAAVIVGVLHAVTGRAAVPQANSKDGGVAACRSLASPGYIGTEAANRTVRAEFAESSYAGLRDAGTTWLDQVAGLPHAQASDAPFDLLAAKQSAETARVAADRGCDSYGVFVTWHSKANPAAGPSSKCGDAWNYVGDVANQLTTVQDDPTRAAVDLNEAIDETADDLSSVRNAATIKAMETTFRDLAAALNNADAGKSADSDAIRRIRKDVTSIESTCDAGTSAPVAAPDSVCQSATIGLAGLHQLASSGKAATPAFDDAIGSALATLRNAVALDTDPLIVSDMTVMLNDLADDQATINSGRKLTQNQVLGLLADADNLSFAC